MALINVYEAKTRLSRLIDRAADGEEIIIARHGRPVARLVPYRAPAKPRRLGALRGRVRMADDFDEPLPPEIQSEFEGER